MLLAEVSGLVSDLVAGGAPQGKKENAGGRSGEAGQPA